MKIDFSFFNPCCSSDWQDLVLLQRMPANALSRIEREPYRKQDSRLAQRWQVNGGTNGRWTSEMHEGWKRAILKAAGLPPGEIEPGAGLAMKAELGILWHNLRHLRRYTLYISAISTDSWMHFYVQTEYLYALLLFITGGWRNGDWQWPVKNAKENWLSSGPQIVYKLNISYSASLWAMVERKWEQLPLPTSLIFQPGLSNYWMTWIGKHAWLRKLTKLHASLIVCVWYFIEPGSLHGRMDSFLKMKYGSNWEETRVRSPSKWPYKRAIQAGPIPAGTPLYSAYSKLETCYRHQFEEINARIWKYVTNYNYK